MIRRLLTRLFHRSPEVRREATVLVTLHGPQGAWVAARDKRRLAEVVDAEDDKRYWTSVMREIERQTGYRHQPDTATRMTEL